jgi:hypothetical protein
VITGIASRVRWLEPVGQFVVLVAIGLQFFFVNPAAENVNKATAGFLQATREEQTLSEHPERAPTSFEMDRLLFALRDTQMSAQTAKAKADMDKERSSKFYVGLFILGTLMAITGKLASVAYSTKSSPASNRLAKRAQPAVQGQRWRLWSTPVHKQSPPAAPHPSPSQGYIQGADGPLERSDDQGPATDRPAG